MVGVPVAVQVPAVGVGAGGRGGGGSRRHGEARGMTVVMEVVGWERTQEEALSDLFRSAWIGWIETGRNRNQMGSIGCTGTAHARIPTWLKSSSRRNATKRSGSSWSWWLLRSRMQDRRDRGPTD